MDTIVIPIQIGTSWILYMTERTTHNQISVRLTRGLNETNSPAPRTALDQLDLLMHNVGRGALDIWLRLLLRDTLVDHTAGRGAIESIHIASASCNLV